MTRELRYTQSSGAAWRPGNPGAGRSGILDTTCGEATLPTIPSFDRDFKHVPH